MNANLDSKGSVYWLTGLSGAGKTTLCIKLVEYLRKHNKSVVMLDGDKLREVIGATNAHTRKDRLKLAMQYSRLCQMISKQGVNVAISTISLFHEVHRWNRINIPGYVEIYLKVPIEELRRRDSKQIYERAAHGQIKNVAGLDFAIDEPKMPDIKIEWIPTLTVEASLEQLINKLKIGETNEN